MTRVDLRLLAPLVSRPGADYQASLEVARRHCAGPHPEAARHLGLFEDRLRELAPDELEELFRETFAPADQAALADAAGALLDGQNGARRLAVLERLLPSLAAARNPFTLLFRALCCLLIAEAVPAGAVALVRSASDSE